MKFPLFQTVVDHSHTLFSELVRSGDTVVDATCGNGHDSLFLANLALKGSLAGKLYVFDIQKAAIENTRAKLSEFETNEIIYCHRSHAEIDQVIMPKSCKLIVYNLGYLPGGNKELTTLVESTISSIKKSIMLLAPGGAISITCYPGHEAGEIEEKALLEFASTLNQSEFAASHLKLLNRRKAPSLLLIQSINN